jgi:integrase
MLALLKTDGLPDPLALIEAAPLSPATKAKYLSVLRAYLDAGGDLADPLALAAYAAAQPPGHRRMLKAAVGKWADRLATVVRSSATPETIAAVDATLHRLAALKDSFEAHKARGVASHIWLSARQVRKLLTLVPTGIEGDRDRAALGLLVAAGLRREEAVSLTFEDLHYKPYGDKMRAVLVVKGKGSKTREVPISDTLAGHLDAWGRHVGFAGKIVRSLGKDSTPGASMSAVGLFQLVQRYGKLIGKPELAPHDLRRTYAQLGFEAGVPITQISRLLGHAGIATTQAYLNLELDLAATASDFIPW